MKHTSKIVGNLDIFVSTENEILIHGDQNGLKSFANLLLELANLDQNKITDLPVGAREHFHLYPNSELSKSSDTVIVGRLDAKGTGKFYSRFKGKY